MKTHTNNAQDISLAELIDITAFQTLLESFTQLTGIPTAIGDLKGNFLIASGWQDICTEFHRKNPITALRCLESDTTLANQLSIGEKYNIYRCKNGLVDVAVPIIIENIRIGNLYIGQFFFEPPDIDFFIRQAEELHFDKDSYLASLSKVPIFSADNVKKAMEFLVSLTVVIGSAGIDRKKLLEYSHNLKKQIQDRTADLKKEIKIRKKAEAQLKENKEFLESVFDSIQDGISVLDRDLNIVQVNRIMHQWYPHLRKSIGEKCYQIYHGRSEICEICPSIRSLETGKIEMDEVPFVSKEGNAGTLELFSFPIKDATGEVKGIVEHVRDITERKRIENQIAIEKNFSEFLINSLPGVMYVFDQFGHFLRWNQNFGRITGYSNPQIQVMNPLDFIATEDKNRVRKEIEKVFREGISTVEAGLATISGEIIPYLFTGYRYAKDDVNCLIGVGIDITERVKTEKEKENLINRLQETLSEVKQLSGLLPICASCKKIRDDKGYWNQLESYIETHSAAAFSHGICPRCSDKLYGNEKWYIEMKKKEEKK